MMDIQSPTCFRNSAATLPRNSSTGSLNLSSTDLTDSSKYIYSRSNSYTDSMVVESQTHNFRSMTPEPHSVITSCDSDIEKMKLQSPARKSLLMTSDMLTTMDDEPVAKKAKMMDDEYLESVSEGKLDNAIDTISSISSKLNGQQYTTDSAIHGLDNSQSESIDSIDMAQFCIKRRRLSDSVTLKNAESFLEDTGLKVGLDKSPPTLSPRTMSDTDFDGTSTGSPSVSINGERRRRKPNIEDIVRRMKEVDTDYYSEDSDNENEVFNNPEAADEVDGDIATGLKMPTLPTQMNIMPIKGENMNMPIKVENMGENMADDKDLLKTLEEKFNENNNVISKVGKDDVDKENKGNDVDDMNGIPLPPSAKPENGESVIKQVGHVTPPNTGSNWLNSSPFNVFPSFPFQQTPEHPFSKFMGQYENKFSSPECEKDYLKCQYCERTFRRQKNLENHVENTHQGKSPVRRKSSDSGDMYFKCNHCPYTTKHQSNLYVHLRIHTGERPYICGACGVQYSQSHSLKSHIINKHDAIMSYYIKEKRTRSPRGLGYLATQPVPGESPVFKMPVSPMLHSQLPGNNGLHFSPVSLPQNIPLKHSPKHNTPSNPPSSVPGSPMMSPNSLQGQPQQPQLSPSNQAAAQLSAQQHLLRPPFPPFHMVHESMEMAQLAKLGLMNFPFYGKPFQGKPSPPFPINGHSPISPNYNNGLAGQHGRQQQTEQPIPPTGVNQQQYPEKPHNPLQEIHENNDDGAIDLRKKSKDEALDLAITDKNKCTAEDPKCPNCLHLLKLKLLRMNVVRMLSILVPNLNFEEKGINAEGDSVDELLREVIDSNA